MLGILHFSSYRLQAPTLEVPIGAFGAKAKAVFVDGLGAIRRRAKQGPDGIGLGGISLPLAKDMSYPTLPPSLPTGLVSRTGLVRRIDGYSSSDYQESQCALLLSLLVGGMAS